MEPTTDKTGRDGTSHAGVAQDVAGPDAAGQDAAGQDSAGQGSAGSKRGIFLILAGLVVTGLVAGYSWLRGLPK